VLVQPEVLAIALMAIALPSLYAAAAARLAGLAPRAGLRAGLAFLWGAVVASSLASLLNDLANEALPALVGADRARVLVPALVGPAVEETLKVAGVAAAFAVASVVRPVRDAIVIGAVVGFGFAAAENITYYTLAAVQGGWDAIGRAVYLRGVVQGANHAAFTATAGAGVGWLWSRRTPAAARLAAALGGLVVATAVHAVWNGIVSSEITTVLCNAPAPAAACAPTPDLGDLAVRVPLLEAAFLVPLAGALRWLAGRAPA
jgi:hypothetical protein